MLNKLKGYKNRLFKSQYTDFSAHYLSLQTINNQAIAQIIQNCHFLTINFV